MTVLYFDCFSGAAGDMLVGALIDAGVDLELIERGLARLDLSGFRVETRQVHRHGLVATKFDVAVDAVAEQPKRHLSDVTSLIKSAGLSRTVTEKSIQVFDSLAQAEARVHGVSVEEVHFHEVGAVDAIVDVLSVVMAVDSLAPTKIVCSPLPLGSGSVHCQHGVIPVPAPATAELIKGVETFGGDEPGELLTPTAAAILTVLCDSFGPVPCMRIENVGMGAGAREGQTRPNVTRVLVGSEAVGDGDAVAVLQASIDDSPGEWIGHCVGRLLEMGALEAFCTPIYMKKGRPGVLLTVLCEQGQEDVLEGVIFRETTTFGIRRSFTRRTKLKRRNEQVETPYGPISMKCGEYQGHTVTASPEYEDCAGAARRTGAAVRTVMEAAIAAWHDPAKGERT